MPTEGASLVEANWEQALEAAASRLAEIITKYGPNSVGVITGGRCTNEENYLLQKFARAVLGTNNIDQSPYLCYSPTLAAFHKSFGLAAATNSAADLEKAGCIFVIGSNPFASQRITSLKIDMAARKGTVLVVANPRGTETDKYAHLKLRLKPGSDIALINGIMKVILDEELWNKEFVEKRCEGFQQLRDSLQRVAFTKTSEITGVAQEDIRSAARLFALGGNDPEFKKPPIYYSAMGGPAVEPPSNSSCLIFGTGVTQQARGEEIVQSLVNLVLLTGQMGKPGAGIGPIAGQNNLQGAVDMGCLPNYLPGQRAISDNEARARFAAHWGKPVPERPGLNLLEIIRAAAEGKIKALYIVGANPALSIPNYRYVQEALGKLELLIVQDIFPTATAQLAHIILPAASYAEKEGTFTNTERRVQRIKPALPLRGEARPDWQVICQLAKRTLAHLSPDSMINFDCASPAEVMAEINQLVSQYAGITYDRIAEFGIQWPCPNTEHPGTDILYEEDFPLGRVSFFPVHRPTEASKSEDEYPFILSTGRTLHHYGTGSETTRSPNIMEMWPEPFLEIGPEDAEALGIDGGDKVRLISKEGEISVRVKVSAELPQGQIFLPFHFPAAPANILTSFPNLAIAKMPELKRVRARIEKLT